MNRYIAIRETDSAKVLLIDKELGRVTQIDMPPPSGPAGNFAGIDMAVAIPAYAMAETARFHFDDEDDIEF